MPHAAIGAACLRPLCRCSKIVTRPRALKLDKGMPLQSQVVSCLVKCILTYENIQHSNQPSFYYSYLRGQKQTTSGKNDFDSHSKISCHSKLVTLHLYMSRCHDTGWMLYFSFFEFWINFPKKTGRQYYKQNFVLKSLN